MVRNFLARIFHPRPGYFETGKIVIISLFALISLFVSVYVLMVSPGSGFQFIYVFIPHLYLIPIILLALWYPKSGLRLIGVMLISIVIFWIFAEIYGYDFNISFVLLYTGLDLATLMVLLLYVKDRRLVEAVMTDLMERREKNKIPDISRFGGEFDVIISALASPDEYQREEAVHALSELDDERVVFPLIRALDDESMYVRKAAVDALGKSNSPKAIHPLLKSLTDEDRCIREASSEALGHLGSLAVPDIVVNMNHDDWRIRVGTVVALRVSSTSRIPLEPLLDTLSDNSPYVRREAVKTLGRIGDHTVVPYLLQATKDPDPGVRLRAIRAVVKLGKKVELLPVLSRLTQDEDGAVRIRAREELNHLQEPGK